MSLIVLKEEEDFIIEIKLTMIACKKFLIYEDLVANRLNVIKELELLSALGTLHFQIENC